MTTWTYRAEAADVLRETKLPIPADRFPVRGASIGYLQHTATYWLAAMKEQDFRTEDHLDTDVFNAALWNGLGSGPQPTVRSGTNLRSYRAARSPEGAGQGSCQQA